MNIGIATYNRALGLLPPPSVPGSGSDARRGGLTATVEALRDHEVPLIDPRQQPPEEGPKPSPIFSQRNRPNSLGLGQHRVKGIYGPGMPC